MIPTIPEPSGALLISVGILGLGRDGTQARAKITLSVAFFTMKGRSHTMDLAYVSALAALAGSAIGGATSFGASWLTQRTQVRAEQVAHDIARREDLYKDFIEEASKLYGDALEHDKADTSKLVRLYALVSRMRVLSLPAVIESAERVIQAIIDTYFKPNITLRELSETLKDRSAIDPLREFSEVCRGELHKLRLFRG